MAATLSVTQNTTAVYTGTLKDELGVPVPGASVTSMTLTLTDVATGTVINSRNAQNVLNSNGVTIDANGLITWTMDPLDNPINDSSLRHEEHLAVFKIKWASKEVDHGVIFCVENIAQNCFACRLLND